MLLASAFLGATKGWRAERKVLNISSGLGRNAMGSQAPYCAAKAGMDHFSRAVALEEKAAADGARIVSLAPGIIDTDMQVALRGAEADMFPDRVRFEKFKADGLLDSPASAAAKILKYLGASGLRRQPRRRYPTSGPPRPAQPGWRWNTADWLRQPPRVLPLQGGWG